MKRSRFTQEQVIGVLKERQAGAAAALCRKHGISDATFSQGRPGHGGMEVSYARLKKRLAEPMLDVSTLREVLAKSGRRPACREQP